MYSQHGKVSDSNKNASIVRDATLRNEGDSPPLLDDIYGTSFLGEKASSKNRTEIRI